MRFKLNLREYLAISNEADFEASCLLELVLLDDKLDDDEEEPEADLAMAT